MSKDHRPGSVTESVFAAGEPQPVHEDELVTVAPLECYDIVDTLTALVIPVSFNPVIPV